MYVVCASHVCTASRCPPADSPFALADQTRGLLKFINENFPVGTLPGVK
jgi:hypothetical protein